MQLHDVSACFSLSVYASLHNVGIQAVQHICDLERSVVSEKASVTALLLPRHAYPLRQLKAMGTPDVMPVQC